MNKYIRQFKIQSRWRSLLSVTSILGILMAMDAAAADDLAVCVSQTSSSYSACKRLADKGHPDGLFGLGILYLEGKGISRDYEKSFRLMLESARLGNEYAQFQVGQAYLNGRGVDKDYEEAYAWFLVSKENRNELAQQGINFLDRNNAVRSDRFDYITQRANDIYASIKNKKGFNFDPMHSQIYVSGIEEFCNMVMPTVDAVILLKKYEKPRSAAQQLMVGMTDPKAIKMMNEVIEWVWADDVLPSQMNSDFKTKCLQQDPEVGFLFDR